jgi:hypothetical protein
MRQLTQGSEPASVSSSGLYSPAQGSVTLHASGFGIHTRFLILGANQFMKLPDMGVVAVGVGEPPLSVLRGELVSANSYNPGYGISYIEARPC